MSQFVAQFALQQFRLISFGAQNAVLPSTLTPALTVGRYWIQMTRSVVHVEHLHGHSEFFEIGN
jgi:hypothetical protein